MLFQYTKIITKWTHHNYLSAITKTFVSLEKITITQGILYCTKHRTSSYSTSNSCKIAALLYIHQSVCNLLLYVNKPLFFLI